MLRVDQIAIIGHKVLAEERPLREVAREFGVSRNTVRKYVREGVPEPVRSIQRRSPKMEEVGPRIEKLLKKWAKQTTPKQRITGSLVHEQLVADGCDVGITTVRSYLRAKRKAAAEVYVPLVHRPGEESQVDFFEVTIELGGVRQQAHLFQMSLPFSDHDFGRIYPREDLAVFLDGHMRAFEHLGGVPRRIVYDNTTLAVVRVVGANRQLNPHFMRLVAHYAYEPDFARVATGHDKGAIEVRGKRTRLMHLVPIPQGETLEEINEALAARLANRARRVRDVEGRTVAERLEEERALMLPLPRTPYDPRLPARRAVSRSATVRLGGATYSVPSHWKLQEVMAWVGAEDIRFEHGGESFFCERAARGGKQIHYLHYLPELARRPHAVRQVAPELVAELGAPWDRLWETLLTVHEPLRAARVISDLLAARIKDEPALEAALSAVLDAEHKLPPSEACPTVPVPAALEEITVEQTEATEYDAILHGGGR